MGEIKMNGQADVIEYDFQEEFIQVNNNCTLCGASLQFEYEDSKSENAIVERCECPSCGLKGKKKTHTVN